MGPSLISKSNCGGQDFAARACKCVQMSTCFDSITEWMKLLCTSPHLDTSVCSLSKTAAQDCCSCSTWSVTPLGWESHKLSDPETDCAAGKGRTSFFAFCATPLRERLCFLKPTSKQTNKRQLQKLCIVIDQLQWYTSVVESVFMFLPTAYAAILSRRDSVRMQTWEKIAIRSARHCGGKRNESCVLSNPQQLGLLGINVFSLIAFWNPGILHPA